jgi:hypothetical protein
LFPATKLDTLMVAKTSKETAMLATERTKLICYSLGSIIVAAAGVAVIYQFSKMSMRSYGDAMCIEFAKGRDKDVTAAQVGEHIDVPWYEPFRNWVSFGLALWSGSVKASTILRVAAGAICWGMGDVGVVAFLTDTSEAVKRCFIAEFLLLAAASQISRDQGEVFSNAARAIEREPSLMEQYGYIMQTAPKCDETAPPGAFFQHLFFTGVAVFLTTLLTYCFVRCIVGINKCLMGPDVKDIVDAYLAEPVEPLMEASERLYNRYAEQVDTEVAERRKWICPIALTLLKDPVKVSYEDETGRRVEFWYEHEQLVQHWLRQSATTALAGTGFINPYNNLPLRDLEKLRIEHDRDLQNQIIEELKAVQVVAMKREHAPQDARITNLRHRAVNLPEEQHPVG